MSDAAANPVLEAAASAGPVVAQASIGQIFLEFLIIGATSFGGVVPYLRGSLVTKRNWLDDKEFVEMFPPPFSPSSSSSSFFLFPSAM